MTHLISEKELDEWLRQPQWQVFASSSGKGSNKRLDVDCADGARVFRVTDHGQITFLGADKAAAVAAYNAAQ